MRFYEVFDVAQESVLESEHLGTKDKFWFNSDQGSLGKSQWLFKFPTLGTGQHWAEKIACEVAKQMRVLAPRVELATFQGSFGSITENFTKGGYELFHGNQILSGFEPTYQMEQRWGQNDHTIGRIFAALNNIFVDPDDAKRASMQMGDYLVLDALICNVDRHHENWGVLRKNTSSGMKGRLAPSYDHASSLGRELRDNDSKNNRNRYLHDLGITKYIERGHGPIFVAGTGRRGPSPIGLIRECLMVDELAPNFQRGLNKLEHLDKDNIYSIIEKIPSSWMSSTAKEFTLSLLLETLKQLTNLR